MNGSLETRLRRQADRWRAVQPPPAPPDLRRWTAPTARSWPILLVAAAAMLLVVAPAVGIALLRHGSATPGGAGSTPTHRPPVPTGTPSGLSGSPIPPSPAPPGPYRGPIAWVATGYQPGTPAPVPGTVRDPSVPWCRAGQLTTGLPAGRVGFQGGGGQVIGGLYVTNTGPAPCALQGTPGAQVLDAAGRVAAATPVASGPPFALSPWIRLAPGGHAVAGLSWWGELLCGTQRPPYRIVAELPNGGGQLTEAVDGPTQPQPTCQSPVPGPVSAEAFLAGELPGQGQGTYVTTTPMSQLEVAFGVSTGPTGPTPRLLVRPGSTLHYVVWLWNSTGSPIRLAPCLGYRESLTNLRTGGAVLTEDHLLNCAALPVIPAHTLVAYRMRFGVPATVPPGRYGLGWETFLPGQFIGPPGSGPLVLVAS